MKPGALKELRSLIYLIVYCTFENDQSFIFVSRNLVSPKSSQGRRWLPRGNYYCVCHDGENEIFARLRLSCCLRKRNSVIGRVRCNLNGLHNGTWSSAENVSFVFFQSNSIINLPIFSLQKSMFTY